MPDINIASGGGGGRKYVIFTGLLPLCPESSGQDCRPTRSTAILLYCSVRDWAQLWYAIGLKNPNSPFRRYQIRCGLLLIVHSGGRNTKYPDSLPNSQDAWGRKPYPERKTWGFKNIRIRVKQALVILFIYTTQIKYIMHNLVPRSLVDEAEGEIWQSKKICFL